MNVGIRLVREARSRRAIGFLSLPRVVVEVYMPAARAAFGHAGPVRHRKITIDPAFQQGITRRHFPSISARLPVAPFPFCETLFPTRKRFHLFLGKRVTAVRSRTIS